MLKICIIRLSGMGNVIFALALAEALKMEIPSCSVSVVTQPTYLPLVEMSTADGGIGLVRLSSSRRATSPLNFARSFQQALGEVRGEKFHILLDLQSFFETTLLSGLSRGRLRLGLVRHPWQKIFFHRVLFSRPRRPAEHQVEEFFRALALAPFSLSPCHPKITPPVCTVRKILSSMAHLDSRPKIGINLGASIAQKRYPLSHIIPIFAHCKEKHYAPLLFWGPQEKRLEPQIQALCRNHPHLTPIPPGPLPQLAGYFSLLDCLISPDTGPLHLASAVGTPVVGLFRQGYQVRYAPLVEPSKVLVRNSLADMEPGKIIGLLEELLPPDHHRSTFEHRE